MLKGANAPLIVITTHGGGLACSSGRRIPPRGFALPRFRPKDGESQQESAP
jgi:hypothetical protein